jgi:hypothetical protein
LAGGVTTQKCLDYIKEARERGLKAPVILMGYYNPIHQYGEEKFVKAAKEAGTSRAKLKYWATLTFTRLKSTLSNSIKVFLLF